MAAWRHSSPQEPSQPYPHTGTPRHGGYRRLFAYMRMKVRGTRTPATGTTAECSSRRLPGDPWVDNFGRTWLAHVNSYGVPFWSTDGTATHGESGERLERVDLVRYLPDGSRVSRAVYIDPAQVIDALAWDRANREALADE